MLDPISPDQPCGADLSFSPEFDQITELRRFDDATLDQGEWVRDIKYADYTGTQRLCAQLLSTQTKDLRLAAWYTDAKARAEGFAGMAEGLQLCTQLCEQFWDGLHPLPDEDGHEQRIGTLAWLLQQITEVAQTQVLIVGKADGASYGRRIIEAVRSRKVGEYDEPIEPNEEQINLAITQTPANTLLAAVDGIAAAVEALANLRTVVDGFLGLDGPAFTAARDALQSTQHMLTRFAKDRGLLQSAEDQNTVADAFGNNAESGNATPGGNFGGAPASRAQALAQLRMVAEFFRRTEPHSPVAYLADKAAKWGEVPLHQWLRSVMKDQASLSQIEEMLGIEAPPAQDE